MRALIKALSSCLFFCPGVIGANYDRPDAWEDIKHIIIVVLENTKFEEAMKQEFLVDFAKHGALLSNYHGVTHPSQPNYIALVAGDFFDVATDNNVNLDHNHLVDLLEKAGKTWKVYAENYPGQGFLDASSGLYRRKHVPFLSFSNVQNNPERLGNIVDLWNFFTDQKDGTLPNFALLIPNLNNDGHDTGVAYASVMMKTYLSSCLNDKEIMKDTLIGITFDEDDHKLLISENHVYLALQGAGINVGANSTKNYIHYSLLRTIEEIYKLGTLGRNDEKANVISDIWQ